MYNGIRFLKLNGICGKPFYVKRSFVVGFHEHTRDGKPCTKLLLDTGEPYYVLDTPEVIAEMLEQHERL